MKKLRLTLTSEDGEILMSDTWEVDESESRTLATDLYIDAMGLIGDGGGQITLPWRKERS